MIHEGGDEFVAWPELSFVEQLDRKPLEQRGHGMKTGLQCWWEDRFDLRVVNGDYMAPPSSRCSAVRSSCSAAEHRPPESGSEGPVTNPPGAVRRRSPQREESLRAQWLPPQAPPRYHLPARPTPAAAR